MNIENIGIIYGMLLATQGVLKDAANKFSHPFVGSPQDHARTELATALQAIEMARYWVSQIKERRHED